MVEHAVFQEIYPRSYMDSNNDGIGDLNGIASKMEYLKWLGVDAIWIAPCFPSPQVDFGYDVSDYENIDPMYGTLADFDRMEKIGKQNGVGIVFDFVVNHTSDKHKWFIESESSKTNPVSRLVHLAKIGKGPNQPPNNWTSTFGGSAWQLEGKDEPVLLPLFLSAAARLELAQSQGCDARCMTPRIFWYKRGVVGFRLDAVDTLFEDPNLTDNPTLPGKNEYGDQNQERKYNDKLPEVHDVMKGPAQGRQSLQRGPDRRDLDERCLGAEGLLRHEPRRAADADGPDVHQVEAVVGGRLPQARRCGGCIG